MPALLISRVSAIGLLIISVLAAPGSSAETGVRNDPQTVARGAHLYRQYCSACHQRDGVGEAPIPSSIRRLDFFTAMPLDESSHAWHHGDEQLIQMILKGTPRSRTRMPVWEGVLSEIQARDLVGYLKSLWSDRIVGCQGPRHMSCM